MAIRTRIDVNGITETDSGGTAGGLQIVRADNKGFYPYRIDAVKNLWAGQELTLVPSDAGVIVASASIYPNPIVMPLASACPGAEFIIRNLEPLGTIITSSQETPGTKVFVLSSYSATSNVITGSAGSKLVLPDAAGACVILKSTGLHFILVGSSGSVAISGT